MSVYLKIYIMEVVNDDYCICYGDFIEKEFNKFEFEVVLIMLKFFYFVVYEIMFLLFVGGVNKFRIFIFCELWLRKLDVSNFVYIYNNFNLIVEIFVKNKIYYNF